MTAAVLLPGEYHDDYGGAIISAVVSERWRGSESFVVGRIVEVCTEAGHMLTHRMVREFFQDNPSFVHVNGSGKGERFRLAEGLA